MNGKGDQFSLLTTVEDVVMARAKDAKNKRIAIMPFVAPEIPQVYKGDPTELKVVLDRMAELALAYSEGEVVIEATAANLAQPLETELEIRFSVSIAGWISSPDPANELRPMVERLGTLLLFSNDPGDRSKFDFSLTLQVADLRAPVPMLPDAIQQKKLFMVSDEPAPNRVMQNYLRFAGMRVDGAATGREALIEIGRQASAGAAYDLLVVADPIADVNSFALAQFVQDSGLSGCPMMFVDLYENETNRRICQKTGFNSYLAKPFTQQQLFEEIVKAFGQPLPTQKAKSVLLIVEDNPINQKLFLFQLRHLGYDADVVATGEAALEAARESEKYSAVLMDLKLPDGDGWDFAKQMRERGLQVPILATSASDRRQNEQRCISSGMNDFLFKPIQLNDMRAALNKWLRDPAHRSLERDEVAS